MQRHNSQVLCHPFWIYTTHQPQPTQLKGITAPNIWRVPGLGKADIEGGHLFHVLLVSFWRPLAVHSSRQGAGIG